MNFPTQPKVFWNADCFFLYSFLQVNIFAILMSKTSVSEFPGNLCYSHFFEFPGNRNVPYPHMRTHQIQPNLCANYKQHYSLYFKQKLIYQISIKIWLSLVDSHIKNLSSFLKKEWICCIFRISWKHFTLRKNNKCKCLSIFLLSLCLFCSVSLFIFWR